MIIGKQFRRIRQTKEKGKELSPELFLHHKNNAQSSKTRLPDRPPQNASRPVGMTIFC
jgi:hypothetical protein